MSHNRKNNVLRQKQLNENNHSLIYSIGQYRKSVTNLAIGCIRKQSLLGIGSKREQRVKNNQRKIDSKENHFGQMRNKYNFGSIPTKKKRYNYGITLQSSSYKIQDNKYQQQSLIDSTRRYNRNQQNIKSYSFLNKMQNYYLTQPFNIDEQKYHKPKSLCQKCPHTNLSYKNLKVAKNTIQSTNVSNSVKQNDNYHSKSKDKLSSFEQIIISKQNISIRKPTLQEKSFFKPKQTLSKINTKQQKSTINYPKTQTYTSRSDYNIQKLTNKLDSYIKKHIQNY